MKRLHVLLITNLGKGWAQRVVHDHAVALREWCSVDEVAFDRGHDLHLYDSGQVHHDLKRDVIALNCNARWPQCSKA